ncbi:hypothetical protein EJ06DRAFT_71768 [Trichodelitschia bisporula]|uniref:Uncharacterized protein n=1 Tax=Trichodelitschia bisporula TaxID=703511 RepID=A0A6G1HT83_9PEZI|nr:hypothetical protein EJ06DRAFT_71768 [Trichodelitschia bisporula]
MSVSDSVLSSTLLSDGLRSDDHRPPPAGVITDRRDAPVAQELQNEAVPDRRPLQLSSSGSAARMEAQPEQLSVPMDTSLPGNALPAFRIVCNTCSNPISAKNPSCAQCQITQSQPGQDQALHLIKAGLPVTTGRVNVSTSSSSLSPYDEDSSSLSSLSPESPPATGPNSATTPALREELFVEQNSTSRSTFPPEYLPTTSAARVLSHSRSNPGENGQLAAATQTGRPPSIFKYKELIALALRRGGRKNAYETWMWVVQNIPNMRADDKKLQAGLSSALAKHPEFVKEEMPGKLRCVYSLRGDYDKSLIDVNKIERLYALHGIHATSAREIEPSGRHAAPHATMTNNQTARNNCRRTLKMPKASQQPPRLSPPRAPQVIEPLLSSKTLLTYLLNLTQPVPALKASQILPASSLKARKSATAFPLAPSSRLDGEHGHAHRITPALPTPSRGQSSTSGINGTVPSKTDTGMRKSSKKRKFSDFVSTEVAEALRLTTHAPSANINGYRTPKFDDPDEATQADVEALFSISNKLPHVDPFVDPSRAPAKGRKGTSRPVESGNGSRPTVKDLFAECPWEDPHWPGNAGFDREAKIAEIKRRPPRKHPIKPPSTTTDTPRNVRYPANPLIQNQRGYFKWMEQRAKEFGAGYAVRPENETTNETSTYTSKANSILVFGTLEAALELPRIPIFSMDKHGYVEVRDASGFHNIQRVWKTTLGHFDEE